MSFYVKSVFVAFGAGLLLLLLLSGFIVTWHDVTAATGFALFFTLSGFLSFSYALKLKNIAFYSIILSSIFIRMTVMVVAIVIWIKYQSIDKKVFLVSLVLWYGLLIIPEIMGFNRIRVKRG
jgi:hypothetical protein